MSDLPTIAEPYVIAEEFCGECGESMGYDLRPLTLRHPVCDLVRQTADEAAAKDGSRP